jgi:hypothetical protein
MTPKPFLPSDIPADRLLSRAVLCHIVAAGRHDDPANVAKSFFPKDLPVLSLVRAASAPAATTTSGWADVLAITSTAAFLGSLQDTAAGALLAAGARFDLAGLGHINLPRASSTGAPQWIAEGGPIPVPQGITVASQLGPVRKIAIIEALSREMAKSTPEGGETIIGQILRDSVVRQLDSSLFSATAASASQPPGLVVGVAALAPNASGALQAALTDLRTLTDAIVAAGGSGSSVMFFMSPGRAVTLKGYFPALASQIFASVTIPSGTLYAVDPKSFVSATGGIPEILASKEALIHFEDTSPQPIGVVGTPNVVAAPARSAYQTDQIMLRCVLRISWVLRVPNSAQWMSAMTW